MKTRALSLSVLTAVILFSESSTAQFWAQRSDEINIGLMISHLRQVTQTNKPGNIGWIHAWPMTVDGVVMDDSTFRRQLGEIYAAWSPLPRPWSLRT